MRTVYRAALYRLGFTPWATIAIPAPVSAAVEEPTALTLGLAIDLGCGTGQQAVYLAAARARARDAAVDAGQLQWRLADVTDPHQVGPDGRLAGRATPLLDNGCLHGVPDTRRRAWADTVHALAGPGCVLLVRAVPRRRHGIGPIGLASDERPALLRAAWDRLPPPALDWHRAVRRRPDPAGRNRRLHAPSNP